MKHAKVAWWPKDKADLEQYAHTLVVIGRLQSLFAVAVVMIIAIVLLKITGTI